MKKAMLLLFPLLLLVMPPIWAYSIGISPDKLVFDVEGEKTFIILNPNEEEIDFVVENDDFEFDPKEGTIPKKASKQIIVRLKDKDDQNRNTNIIVKLKKDSAILPGAVLKAEVIGLEEQEEQTEIDDYTFNWLLVFFSTIFFGFLIFILAVEIFRWLRGG